MNDLRVGDSVKCVSEIEGFPIEQGEVNVVSFRMKDSDSVMGHPFLAFNNYPGILLDQKNFEKVETGPRLYEGVLVEGDFFFVIKEADMNESEPRFLGVYCQQRGRTPKNSHGWEDGDIVDFSIEEEYTLTGKSGKLLGDDYAMSIIKAVGNLI